MKTTSDQAEASTITPASVFQLGGHHPTHPASSPACVATRREQLELVAGLAEAYGECEDLGGFDREHEVRICENSLFVSRSSTSNAIWVDAPDGAPTELKRWNSVGPHT